MSKNMMSAMIMVRRRAAIARCRVKAWRPTDDQAFLLAREIALEFGDSALGLYEKMRAGQVSVLGAMVSVRK